MSNARGVQQVMSGFITLAGMRQVVIKGVEGPTSARGRSQFPHKSVDFSFIITNVKNKLPDLCGN